MNKNINQEVFKKILSIRFEMGYQSGRWSENEYIQDEIAITEFNYITSICDEENFLYEINWNFIEETADEYCEEKISIKDIIDVNINESNFWQFDTLACDIEEQVIKHLQKQL